MAVPGAGTDDSVTGGVLRLKNALGPLEDSIGSP